VAGRAKRQGVQIDCDAPDKPVYIAADIGQMRQVLLNLLLNALDAVPAGGKVGIEIRDTDRGTGRPKDNGAGGSDAMLRRWLSIRVSDTGCGLPPELGDRIFEPFVTSKETGLGLGLPICKRIVDAHGGEILAANRPEGGAVFTVRLPLSTTSGRPPQSCEPVQRVSA